MDNYKPTVGIEPTDKYKKAKQDLLAARKSFCELTRDQQWQLIHDLFGAEAVTTLCQTMQKYFARGDTNE